jgi:hypothetical protein
VRAIATAFKKSGLRTIATTAALRKPLTSGMTGNEITTLAIAGASLIVAVVSARIAWVATDTARKQLALVERKSAWFRTLLE